MSESPHSIMHIQVNTDHTISGREALNVHVRSVVEKALGHLASHITRVEVHLADENGDKNGQLNTRCMMEARLEARPPAAVTHHAANVHQAVAGAAHKLTHLIENTVGRQDHERSHRTDPSRPPAEVTD